MESTEDLITGTIHTSKHYEKLKERKMTTTSSGTITEKHSEISVHEKDGVAQMEVPPERCKADEGVAQPPRVPNNPEETMEPQNY